jgi:hypothetical protein
VDVPDSVLIVQPFPSSVREPDDYFTQRWVEVEGCLEREDGRAVSGGG